MIGAVRDRLRIQLAALSDGSLSGEEIDPTVSLLDHGYLDSLSAAAFLAGIEDEYGVVVSEVDLLGPLQSLEQLARYLQDEAPA